MMKFSQVALSCCSRSRLESICAVTTRGPLRPSIWTTALLEDSANRETSPGAGRGGAGRGGAGRGGAGRAAAARGWVGFAAPRGPPGSRARLAARRQTPRRPAPRRTRHDAAHVVAHVGKVEVGVGDRKVDVELRDLLPQQQEVHDREQLRVELARGLGDDARGVLGGVGVVVDSGGGWGARREAPLWWKRAAAVRDAADAGMAAAQPARTGPVALSRPPLP
jgi:hypothetical protein